MATIAEVRAQYPQYQDMDDATLATALHKKFYNDLPFEDFAKRAGLSPETTTAIVNREAARARIEGERGIVQDVDDRMRAVGRGVPLIGGAMDEVSAGLNTGFGLVGDYDKELTYQRERDADYDARHPKESTAEQIGGGIAGAIAGVRQLGPVAMPSSAIGKAGVGAAIGGGGGYAEGFTRGEGGAANRNESGKWSAAIGSVIGGAAPAIGNAIGRQVAKVTGKSEVIPTVEQIHGAKSSAYQAAKDSGLVLKPTAFNETADNIVAKFVEDAVDADLQPKANILMKRLQEAKDKPLTLSDLDNLRKKAVRITQGPDKDEAYFAGQMIEQLDDFIDNLAPEAVTTGNAREAGQLITNARDLAKRARKAEVIELAVEKANNAVGPNYNTAGWQTAVQQQFRRIADNPKLMRLYNPDEVRMIKAVVNGARGQVLLNIVRKFNPSSALALVGATANPALGVPALVAGQIAKAGSARMTKGAVQQVDELVRRGGPAPKQITSQSDAVTNVLLPQAGLTAEEIRSRLRGR
jgi:hypothetical protein